MPRVITISVPDDVPNDRYADLAHGAWMLLQIADLAHHRDAAVEADAPGSTLTDRWEHYGKVAPWRAD